MADLSVKARLATTPASDAGRGQASENQSDQCERWCGVSYPPLRSPWGMLRLARISAPGSARIAAPWEG